MGGGGGGDKLGIGASSVTLSPFKDGRGLEIGETGLNISSTAISRTFEISSLSFESGCCLLIFSIWPWISEALNL